MGLEIYPHVPAPISFDHATQRLVAQPAYAAQLAAALAAFNDHDYVTARTLLDQVADPLPRAWGYAWLLGWLTGEEQDLDTDLLEQTRDLLTGLDAPDSIAVASLLDEVRDVALGWFHCQARGYKTDVVPGSLNTIVANLSAGVQLLEQLDDDILQTTPQAWSTESPLAPKAAFLIARNLYSRNTKFSDPESPYADYWLGILNDRLAPVQALFPRAANLRVFTFIAQNYAVTGGLIKNWKGLHSVPDFDPAETWWASHTELADVTAAPAWANIQRRYHRAFRNAGTWWITNRLKQGQLGGGAGDDNEGARLLAVPSLACREPGGVLETGVGAVMQAELLGPLVDQQQGYFNNAGDVEHAAKFTTNPLAVLLRTHHGDPRYLEFAMRTIRNMDETDANSWTVLDPASGKRRFLSYVFGANAVKLPGRDIPLNSRAVLPGFFLLDYNGSPRIRQMFEEWAREWASHAMATTGGKPAGFSPARSPRTPTVGSCSALAGTGGRTPDTTICRRMCLTTGRCTGCWPAPMSARAPRTDTSFCSRCSPQATGSTTGSREECPGPVPGSRRGPVRFWALRWPTRWPGHARRWSRTRR